MVDAEARYAFERHGGPRGGLEAQAAYDTLLRRLRVTPDEVRGEGVDRTIRSYVVEVPLNIAWYDAAWRREHRYHRAFLGLTIGLLVVALPLLGYLPVLALQAELQGSTTVAQVTGILTGLLALQRSAGVVFDRRKRVALFHESAAELKELLYSLEDRWRGGVLVDGKVSPEFLEALRDDIKAAKAIARDERKKFFQALQSTPSVDLGSMLQRGASQASAVSRPATAIARTARRTSPHAVRVEVAEQRAVVQTLERLLAEATAEYRELAETEPSLASAAKSNLGTLTTKLRDAKIKLAELEAHLVREP